jgi:hypothetical protein
LNIVGAALGIDVDAAKLLLIGVDNAATAVALASSSLIVAAAAGDIIKSLSLGARVSTALLGFITLAVRNAKRKGAIDRMYYSRAAFMIGTDISREVMSSRVIFDFLLCVKNGID